MVSNSSTWVKMGGISQTPRGVLSTIVQVNYLKNQLKEKDFLTFSRCNNVLMSYMSIFVYKEPHG